MRLSLPSFEMLNPRNLRSSGRATALFARLAARAHWLTIEWLPKYAPELNDIELVWRDLKAHHLAHQTFTDAAALDQAIHDAVTELNRERMPNPLATPRILPRKWLQRGYGVMRARPLVRG